MNCEPPLRRAFAAFSLLLVMGLTLLQMAPPVHAQLAVPPLQGHVTDQTGTLTPDQRDSLEQTLRAFEARKGSQIAVLLVNSTAPEPIEPFALRVAEQWKLGRKKVDDGAILVVAKNDRTLRIEVGYGLEGVLPDASCKRIIEETVAPHFKQGDYFGGLQAGLQQIMQLVDGEPLPPPANPTNCGGGVESLRAYAPLLFIIALALGSMLRSALGRLPGSLLAGAAVSALTWFVIGSVVAAVLAGIVALFLTLVGGNTVLRGLGGFYGGGGRGDFGGGGFRGGGGGFGGGGASGRW